ncbi:MAG: Cytochrome B561 [uncultured Caballeronia sp.]|nr:MAG: Cytochrome B561 [uncultured Caballeronia sp.]
MSTQAANMASEPLQTEMPLRYTRTAMVLHWLIALLIICNVVLGLTAESFPDSWVRPVVDTHKSIGITVLGLVLLRILWRVSHRPPPLPKAFPKRENVAAHIAHFLLYLLLIGLPLSG